MTATCVYAKSTSHWSAPFTSAVRPSKGIGLVNRTTLKRVPSAPHCHAVVPSYPGSTGLEATSGVLAQNLLEHLVIVDTKTPTCYPAADTIILKQIAAEVSSAELRASITRSAAGISTHLKGNKVLYLKDRR